MLLALDLATRTGICSGDPTEVPSLSHHILPSTGADVGRFLDAAEKFAAGLIERAAPALVVFEAPILPRETQVATVRKLQGLAGMVELVCHRAGVECAEVSTTAVKKALTGKGNAKKPDMLAAAEHYGFDPRCDDEADAFGVWLCALRLRFPQHAHHWDPLTQGRRPA